MIDAPTRLTCGLLAITLAACLPDDLGRPGRQRDAGPDGSIEACVKQSFYDDKDGDGHGDPSSLIRACEDEAPAGTVTTSDDCDDRHADVHPGGTEVCDGADNDCSAATVETCPANCVPVRRLPPDDARVYLFCGNAQSWPNARTTCTNAGYHLVEIDSAAENLFVRTEATTRFGNGEIHIGASDAGQANTWQWDGGEVFWTGNQNGQAVNARFAAWSPGDEPNGSGDCAELRTDLEWYDNGCGDNQRFVCRK